MTATHLRYRRYLNRTRSTDAITEFFREYPQFSDCEFNCSGTQTLRNDLRTIGLSRASSRTS
jgi:hypothetical protein